MKIFFDTEFTGLYKTTTLISLGMIDEFGRTFYAEFLDYDKFQCNEWIQNNVIKNLRYKEHNIDWCDEDSYHCNCVGHTYFVRDCLKKWLSEYDNVELVSDVCHYDMVLFVDIFGSAFDIPKNVSPCCYDINQDIAKFFKVSMHEAFDISREGIIDWYNSVRNNFLIKDESKNKIEINGDKHNSLYDACVIKAIYEIINHN